MHWRYSGFRFGYYSTIFPNWKLFCGWQNGKVDREILEDQSAVAFDPMFAIDSCQLWSIVSCYGLATALLWHVTEHPTAPVHC